jgi:hypothetical protein
MTEEQIAHMAERFLSWSLPEDFSPDGGVSFDRLRNAGTEWEARNTPTGTNLLNLQQAVAMVRHITEDLPRRVVPQQPYRNPAFTGQDDN